MRTATLKTSRFVLCTFAFANLVALCWRFPITTDLIGCGWLLYKIAARETRTKWLGWMTLGLFAGAYQVVAPGDLRSVFLLIGGCYLIGYSEDRVRDALGMICLAAAHSPVFLMGGVAYLIYRDVRSGSAVWRSWAAIVIGLGIAIGSARSLDLEGFTREGFVGFVELISRRFLVPVALAGAGLQLSLERGRPMNVWVFFLPVAFVSALFSTAAFLPFGVWLVLAAVLTLPQLTRELGWLDRVYFPAVAMTLALAAFAYTGESSTFGGADASLRVLATNPQTAGGRNAPRNAGGDDNHRDHGRGGVSVGIVVP